MNENLSQTPPEPAEGLAGPIDEIPADKLAEMEARLAEFKANRATTGSGSEAPDAPVEFDLSQWEVETDLEHLYKRSRLEDTDEGPKWVVMEHQYMIQLAQWHMDNSGQPMGKNKQGKMMYHAKSLDSIITEIINGPDGLLSREKGWRLSALLPGQMGQGIAVFERQVKRALPDPKPIVKPEEQPLEKVGDEELSRLQERSQGWTAAESGAGTEGPEVAGSSDIAATTDEGTSDSTIGEPDAGQGREE